MPTDAAHDLGPVGRVGTGAQRGIEVVAGPVEESSPRSVVMDAALVCFGRWGVAKSTLDDIARESGISRATVYRLFSGGKPALVDAVAARELARLAAAVRLEIDASENVQDAVVAGVVTASRCIADHAALNHLLKHERAAILPFIAFDRLEPALLLARTDLAPAMERFVDRSLAEEIVEWCTRIVLSLNFSPSAVDPTSEAQVASLVGQFLAPGLLAATTTP